MDSVRPFCVLIMVLVLGSTGISMVVMCDASTERCEFPALYNFGNSNSDTGGISAAMTEVPPPNGETFFGHPSGRFSDGRLIIDFIGKTPPFKSGLPRPRDFSRALYTFDIGQNDLSYGFKHSNEEQVRATIPDILNQFSQAVQQLYKEGARFFWIPNTGTLGCLPNRVIFRQPKPSHPDQNGCMKSHNEVAQ